MTLDDKCPALCTDGEGEFCFITGSRCAYNQRENCRDYKEIVQPAQEIKFAQQRPWVQSEGWIENT